MKRVIFAAAGSIIAGALTVSSVLAVPPHQHYIVTPAITNAIAGDTCEGPMPHEPAFHNLHNNVHVGVPGNEAMDQTANPVDISAVFCS